MADVNVVGSLEAKFESTNRIYDVWGCSPTLSTMQGGNQEPKILETKQLGFMDNGTGKHQSNTVYDENALCPNITTVEGGGTQQIKVCESQIVAMRGRNPDNPSDRTVGSPTEQRLEVNTQGTSNCLTSVQKDNLVMEPQVLTPKRTEYGKQIRKAYESGQIQESRHNMTELEPRRDNVSNTLTTVQKDNLLLENVKIRQATKGGSIECEIGGCFDASYPKSKTRRGRVQDKGNTCPTLTAQNQEVVRIEKPLLLGGVGKENEFGSQYRQGNRVYSSNACAMALNAQPVGNTGGNSYLYNVGYRIRKLTPKECGRLMGVSDDDIDKMAAVNSNTQLYKQFGNSIVVDVMCAMFKNLNIQQEDNK